MVLAMCVASDYKLRTRAPGQSLSGRADVAVYVELVVYVLAAVFVVLQLGVAPTLKRLPPLLVAAWGFAITLALTAFYAVYPTLALVRAGQLLFTCALAHAIALRADRTHLHRLVHGFIGLVTVSVMFGLAKPFPRDGLQAHRFNWLYVHPVMAATYLGLTVVLLLGLLLRERRDWPTKAWPTPVYGLLLVVNLGALLATRTRGGLAGCVVGCFVVAMSSNRGKSRLDVVVLSTVVAILAAVLAGAEILSYLQRGESSQALSTLSNRTALWGQAWKLFLLRPLFGYGLTASRGLFFESVGLGGGHNALVNVMVDAGIFGVVAGAVLIGVLVHSARAERWWRPTGDDVPIILGVLGFLLMNSFTVEFMGTPANVANIWLFILVGWVLVLRRARLSPVPPPVPTSSSLRAPVGAPAAMVRRRPPDRRSVERRPGAVGYPVERRASPLDGA